LIVPLALESDWRNSFFDARSAAEFALSVAFSAAPTLTSSGTTFLSAADHSALFNTAADGEGEFPARLPDVAASHCFSSSDARGLT
jgi:hypothetical protein